jgi:protoporphyrinogen oxidase
MSTQTVCIVGGGPAGIGLLWALAQDVNLRDVVAVTVVHDQPELGGHCSTSR